MFERHHKLQLICASPNDPSPAPVQHAKALYIKDAWTGHMNFRDLCRSAVINPGPQAPVVSRV